MLFVKQLIITVKSADEWWYFTINDENYEDK